MMCDDAGLLMHAYLDDELDAANSAAMARHLGECVACKARYQTYTIMQKALSEPSLYHRAPDALRARWSTPRRTSHQRHCWYAVAAPSPLPRPPALPLQCFFRHRRGCIGCLRMVRTMSSPRSFPATSARFRANI